MSLSIGELVGYVDLDTKGLDRGLKKVDGGLGKAGKAFGGLGKKVLGIFAGVGAVSLVGNAFNEANEAMKVGKQTEAVIKSTGGAAKVTADHVADLAGAISNKTGIDDEAIQSGQNMLLTFKNVKNEAGKGNKIFDETTKTMVDMSAAMGTDAKGSAIMLGKALNDPTKGLSALGRVGITFTDQQKDQIKSLQASGDMMGAQKIILKELKSEFGGSAEAIATPADKARVTWGNFQETLGMAVMPVVNKLMNLFIKAMPTIVRAVESIGPAVSKLGPVFRSILTFLQPVIDGVRKFFTGFTSGEGTGKLAQVQATFTSVFANVKSVVLDAVTIVTALWNRFGSTIVAYAQASLGNLLTFLRGAFQVIAGLFQIVSSLIKGDWSGVWQGIKKVAAGVMNMIKGAVKQFWNIVRTLFSIGGSALRAIMSRAWDGIKSLVSAGIGKLVGFVKGIPGKFRSALGSLGSVVGNVFSNAMNGALGKVKNIGSTIVGWIRGIPGKMANLGGAFGRAGKDLLQGFIDGMKNAAGIISGIAGNVWDSVRGLLNGAIDRINSALEFNINTPGPGGISINPANIPHLRTGGRGQANSPMLATVFDANEPETVLRDSQLSVLMREAAKLGAASAGDTGKGRTAPAVGVMNNYNADGNVVAEQLWFLTRKRG